jgi:acyl carrier protein
MRPTLLCAVVRYTCVGTVVTLKFEGPYMTKNVNAKVIELITNTNAHLPCPVNSMTRFVADLGMDSLDLVETVMMLEDEFGIELDNEDALNTVVTVEDISKLIRQALANAGTNAVDPKFESLKSVVNIVDTAVAEISEGFIGQAAQGALHILTNQVNAFKCGGGHRHPTQCANRTVGRSGRRISNAHQLGP